MDYIKIGNKVYKSPKYLRVEKNYGISPETIRKFGLKIKVNDLNLKIWQLNCSFNMEAIPDPMFIARNSKEPDRIKNPFFENNDIIDIYYNESWQDADFIGIVSRRFYEKTKLTYADIASVVTKDYQCYSLSPKSYKNMIHTYQRKNVTGIQEICKYIDSWNVLPLKLATFNGESHYCNYWLLTPDRFRDYVENWLMPVINILTKSDKSKFVYEYETKHRKGENYKSVVFFLEGLFSVYASTQRIKSIQ